jgi:xylose isomerase
MFRHAVISGFLSETRDRFSAYGVQRDLRGRVEYARSISGCTAVEVVYPYEVSDPKELSSILAEAGMGISAVNVNVKAEPEFQSGSLSSPQDAIRERAVRMVIEAREFAAQVGAPLVTCCPLSDGYDFDFEVDYERSWDNLSQSIAEAGTPELEVPLFLEYKPKEIRRKSFLARAADILVLLAGVENPSIGVTLDYGHSIYAGEHPAEALSLIRRAGRPYYVHINDNDRTWDWDYFCGTHSLLTYIEFIYYLHQFGYQGYLTSDTQPTRWDARRTIEANIVVTERIENRIASVGLERISEFVQSADPIATFEFLQTEVLGLSDDTVITHREQSRRAETRDPSQ